MRLHRVTSAWLVVLALAGQPACNRESPREVKEDTQTPVRGGTVVIAMGQEPETLMPYAHRSLASSTVLSFIYRMLADTGPDFMSFEPSVAERWEFSEDHKSLTMFLRGDVMWSDGVPLTAEDVRFSWEVARDEQVGWVTRHWKEPVTDCEILDPHTVRFHFAEVFRDQFRYAKEGFLIPKHLLEGVPRDAWASSDFAERPVGCGPFRLERWERGQRIVLARNEHFFVPGQPYLDRIVIEFIADPAVRVQQLRAGLVDFLPYDMELRDAAELRAAFEAGQSDVRIVSTRGRTWDYIGYNLNEPLFQSRQVREALTRAIDRRAIIEGLCYGYAELFESPVMPILWAYDGAREITPYDPEGARRLLAAAGWRDTDGDGWVDKDGKAFEFTVFTNKDNKIRTDALVPVQRDWRAVGVKANIEALEATAGRELREQRRFQAYYGGWNAAVTVDLSGIWGCQQVGGRHNFIDYCNPRVDSLNALGLREMDPTAAKPYFVQAQRLVADDYPYTWMYYIHSVVGIRSRLHGVRIDARSPMQNMEEWWVAGEAHP